MLHREVILSAERPNGGVLVIATYLPLRRWRHFVAFVRLSGKIQEQLRRSEGVLQYGVAADVLRKRFWTVSIWRSREAAAAFIQAEPHATAVRRFPDWAADGARFVRWTTTEPRISWDDVLRRLEATTSAR